MRALLAVSPLVAMLLVGSVYAQQPPSHNWRCVGPDTAGIQKLQHLVRQLQPEVLAPAVQRDSLVVGLVFDSSCQVVRHTARRRRASDGHTVDSTLAGLFPDLGAGPAPFLQEGVADAVPPGVAGHPMVVYGVLRTQ